MAGHPLVVCHTALPKILAPTEISKKIFGPVLSCTVLLEIVTFWQSMLHQIPGPPLPYTTFWSTIRLVEEGVLISPACHPQSQPPTPWRKVVLRGIVDWPCLLVV